MSVALVLISFLNLVACDQTTSIVSYSVPVDESAVQSVLSTITDTALRQLFSQFQAARGTSAALSIASVYGSQILNGEMTDLNSLALAIATISGTQTKNDGTSIITDSRVTSFETSTGGIITDDQANLTSVTTMNVVISGASELKFTSDSSSNTYNSTSSQKAAAVKLFAATPLAFGAAIFALL